MRKLQLVRSMQESPVPREKAVVERGDELTDWDHQVYRAIVSTDLSDEQRARLTSPAQVFPRQEEVLAVHWHQEFVPLDVVMARVDATFPNRSEDLIIPTQHNVLTALNGRAGVEVDCFSRGFNRKVQLLLHFSEQRVKDATVLRSMLAHTFKYRGSQLFEFIGTILEPTYEYRLQQAAERTGAEEALVDFVRRHVRKLKRLIEMHEAVTPPESIKNKLIRHYFDALRRHVDERTIQHAQTFLAAVKALVKASFTLQYFYQTAEIIEEVRSIGGGIIVPHPEQFWPILLAEYDVDGYEVWNPQSQEFTEFLVNVVHRQNRQRRGGRELLITMGDDTHMGEKALDPKYQDPEKAGREIGVQPAWDDMHIRKSLIVANVDRRRIIQEYKSRLA
ncbi:MAG: hypothetical protein CHACPFDD_01094 [Phycisphaerae bacterium]|nr:hypothetical protein [Phycisphaerae bacterium]